MTNPIEEKPFRIHPAFHVIERAFHVVEEDKNGRRRPPIPADFGCLYLGYQPRSTVSVLRFLWSLSERRDVPIHLNLGFVERR